MIFYTHNFTVSLKVDHKSPEIFKAKTCLHMPLKFPGIFQHYELSSKVPQLFISCIFHRGNLIQQYQPKFLQCRKILILTYLPFKPCLFRWVKCLKYLFSFFFLFYFVFGERLHLDTRS